MKSINVNVNQSSLRQNNYTVFKLIIKDRDFQQSAQAARLKVRKWRSVKVKTKEKIIN